jgi:hypothetical protein
MQMERLLSENSWEIFVGLYFVQTCKLHGYLVNTHMQNLCICSLTSNAIHATMGDYVTQIN